MGKLLGNENATPALTPPAMAPIAQQAGGRGNAAAQEGLADKVRSAPTEWRPLVPTSIAEAHPDGKLESIAGSMYGEVTRNGGPLSSRYGPFEATELGPVRRLMVEA